MATKRPRKTKAKTKAAAPAAALPPQTSVVPAPDPELLKRVQELEGRGDTQDRTNKELRRNVRSLEGRVEQLVVLVQRALKAQDVFSRALVKEVGERRKQGADQAGELAALSKELHTLTRQVTEGVLGG